MVKKRTISFEIIKLFWNASKRYPRQLVLSFVSIPYNITLFIITPLWLAKITDILYKQDQFSTISVASVNDCSIRLVTLDVLKKLSFILKRYACRIISVLRGINDLRMLIADIPITIICKIPPSISIKEPLSTLISQYLTLYLCFLSLSL